MLAHFQILDFPKINHHIYWSENTWYRAIAEWHNTLLRRHDKPLGICAGCDLRINDNMICSFYPVCLLCDTYVHPSPASPINVFLVDENWQFGEDAKRWFFRLVKMYAWSLPDALAWPRATREIATEKYMLRLLATLVRAARRGTFVSGPDTFTVVFEHVRYAAYVAL